MKKNNNLIESYKKMANSLNLSFETITHQLRDGFMLLKEKDQIQVFEEISKRKEKFGTVTINPVNDPDKNWAYELKGTLLIIKKTN